MADTEEEARGLVEEVAAMGIEATIIVVEVDGQAINNIKTLDHTITQKEATIKDVRENRIDSDMTGTTREQGEGMITTGITVIDSSPLMTTFVTAIVLQEILVKHSIEVDEVGVVVEVKGS